MLWVLGQTHGSVLRSRSEEVCMVNRKNLVYLEGRLVLEKTLCDSPRAVQLSGFMLHLSVHSIEESSGGKEILVWVIGVCLTRI